VTQEKHRSERIARIKLGDLVEVPPDFFIGYAPANLALSHLSMVTPEIADVLVVPLGEINPKDGHPGGNFQYNRNSKLIRLPEFNEHDREQIGKLGGLRKLVAGFLKIKPDSVTDEMFVVFTIAHEIGHAIDASSKTFEEWQEIGLKEEGIMTRYKWLPLKKRIAGYRQLPREKYADDFALARLNKLL